MTPSEILDRHFGYDAADPQWVTDQLVLAGDLRTIKALEATPRHMGLQSGEVLDHWMREPVSRRTKYIAWGIAAFCLAAIIAIGVPGAIASYQLGGLL